MAREERVPMRLPSRYEQVAKCVCDRYHERSTMVGEVQRFDALLEGGGHEVYFDTFLNSYFPERY